MIESILSYGWDIWAPDYKLQKKLLSTEMDVWRGAARTTKLLKVRNEAIREKIQITQNFGKTGKQLVEIVWTCMHGG